jgi:hypothetical protein
MMAVGLKSELESRLKEVVEEQDASADAQTPDEEWLAPRKEYGILQRTLTPEEWIREARAFAESNRGVHIPPDEALERESIYADHD